MLSRAGLLLAAAVAAACAAADTAAAPAKPPAIQPFALADVSLGQGHEFLENFEQNAEYLLMLEPDNLLYNFRLTAGLPTPGATYGGWENSAVEVRGQFIGHYLSAVAFAYNHTGRREFRKRGEQMVQGLRAVQDAFGNGYLSAFPESHFDRLEALQPVWAPYYVIHKLIAGMLDQYQLAGSGEALKSATMMADYFCGRVANVVAVNGTDYWARVLEVEYGGMNEALYNLYTVTGDAAHADCAHWFDKPAFYEPMVEGRDVMPGLHANTHLAQVNGFGARFEAVGDKDAAAALSNFYRLALQHHSFSTGGSNWYEHWGGEDSLGDALNNTDASALTEESCTQYNILKIARYLFRWTGDAAIADFYERAILNDVIGIQKRPLTHTHGPGESHSHSHGAPHSHQHAQQAQQASAARLLAQGGSAAAALPSAASPYATTPRPQDYNVVSWPEDPGSMLRAVQQEGGPGVYIYFLPLGSAINKGDKSHSWSHGWGDPFNTFWCCYGTAVESFAKIADSIYFKRMPSAAPGVRRHMEDGSEGKKAEEELPELFINQYVSSTLTWRELGVTVHQEADHYSPNNAARATLRVSLADSSADGGEASAHFALNWRIPAWVKPQGLTVSVNGKAFDGCAKGAAAAAAAGGEEGGHAPPFGRGAHFCVLGPEWRDGDEVEVVLPYRITTEMLNDARKPLRTLRAIMMGPLLMAGLTQDTRELVADPERIESYISLPDSKGLVSLSAALPHLAHQLAAGSTGGAAAGSTAGAGAGQGPHSLLLLRHSNGTVLLGGAAAALDATFRLGPPLAGGTTTPGGGAPAGRALLMAALRPGVDGGGILGVSVGGEQALLAGGEPRLASFEAASLPGHFLTADPASGGGLLLAPAGADVAPEAQSFVLHPQPASDALGSGPSQEGAAPAFFTLEPLSSPGSRVAPPVVGAREAGGSAGAPLALRLAPAAGSYPRGARLLKGRNRAYVLVPIGQINDEVYTGYFEFVAEPAGLAAAA